jgi:hypothetical protein
MDAAATLIASRLKSVTVATTQGIASKLVNEQTKSLPVDWVGSFLGLFARKRRTPRRV